MSAQVATFLLGIYHEKSRSSLTILQRCKDVVRMIIDYTQVDVLKAVRPILVNANQLDVKDPLLRQLLIWKGGKEALRELYPRAGWPLCLEFVHNTEARLPNEMPNLRWLLEQLYAISWLGRGTAGATPEEVVQSGHVFTRDQIQGIRYLSESSQHPGLANHIGQSLFVQCFGVSKTDAQLQAELGFLFGEPSLEWFLSMFENRKDVMRWRKRVKDEMVLGDILEFGKYDRRTIRLILMGYTAHKAV
ncbi:hypothetical protein BJ741DRAFT_574379 [Chytriomyces cf. hyalinus JEL632]|nr:hypothetical protein BJ741DRAFT_574379 [Chytriomyces cf. hyalinus JEL632]